jgi:cytochrome c oxidase subunit 1
VANAAFGISTILIAVPTGVKIFNWLGTMWGGSLRFTTPMLFSVGFIAMFTIGGLTGVTHAIVPSDYQQQDTYYIVAHFHQVLFGGALFGLFSGIYYWLPKFSGKLLNETWGKIHFWTMFIGFNLTFQPMMILGLLGMPRRIHSYPDEYGWEVWNMLATTGAFFIAGSILIFIINVIISQRSGEEAGPDPWDGRTLEWAIPSPPPAYNFAEIPHVRSLDDFWRTKYVEAPGGRPLPVPSGASDHPPEGDAHHGEGGHGIHLPSPSYFPLIAAIGLPIIALGLMYEQWAVVPVGVLTTLVGLYGWVLEPATEP